MNPIYAIMESPHRWLILASFSFGAGLLGALMFLAWDWSHTVIRVWFYTGFVLTLYFSWRVFAQWKEGIEAMSAPPPTEGERPEAHG